MRAQGEPGAQLYTALPPVLSRIDRPVGLYLGRLRLAPVEERLGAHAVLSTPSVPACQVIVEGHALVHAGQLLLQLPALPVEHKQHGGVAEGPRAPSC